MVKKIIAWDLGATKCTAGIVEYNSITHALACKQSVSMKLTSATSLNDLVHQLETALKIKMAKSDAICIGGAGHYDGEFLQLENAYPYPMHIADIARLEKWPNYAVLHDYAPLVCATFTSYMEQPQNIKRLNTCKMRSHGRRVTFGIGTGLGLKDGVLLDNGDFWLGKNEVGHIGIMDPPHAEAKLIKRHKEFLKYLREKIAKETHCSVTYEKILSGQGTVRLYQFFHPEAKDITPEEVGEKMRGEKCKDMVDLFAWFIGLFVGTIQLSFMPEGGIWIAGGVSLNHLDVFDRPDFNAGIYASPAYLRQREEYPLGILCNRDHALIGSGYYAAKRLL